MMLLNEKILSFIIIISVFILTFVFERRLIPKLKKEAKQPIYQDGPKWHNAKAGTPTMGGLGFLLSVTLILTATSFYLLGNIQDEVAVSIFLCVLFAFLNSVVGIIDDIEKIKKSQNLGLKPYQKLILQTLIATLFVFLHSFLISKNTVLHFSFFSVDLGFLYYPMVIFILVGLTNCANLCDGIDGLATSVSFAIACVLLAISINTSKSIFFISSSLIGATLSFLIFNINPAKIFMGDTGSLFLGSLIGSCMLWLKNPLMILFICAVYIIEGVSVVTQVLVFKITGKRVFKMAPFHHHLEKCGWSETKICAVFIILTFVLSLPAFLILL